MFAFEFLLNEHGHKVVNLEEMAAFDQTVKPAQQEVTDDEWNEGMSLPGDIIEGFSAWEDQATCGFHMDKG